MSLLTTTITAESVQDLNARLAAKNSPYRIVVQSYPGMSYDSQLRLEIPPQTPQPFLVDEATFYNDSDIPQSFTDTVTKTHEESNSLTITAGLKSTFSYEGGIDIEGISAKTSASIELSVSAEKTNTVTDTISFEKTIPLVAPPFSKITLQLIAEQFVLTNVPFTVDVTLRNGAWTIFEANMAPVYRKYGHGDHFYTTNPQEGNSVGYSDEGILGYVYQTQKPGTVAVYRKYGHGDHFYTTNPQEGNSVGYSDEGILGYVYPQATPGTIPVYRKYGHGDHFYTTNPQEGNSVGYSDEGVLGYFFPPTGLNVQLESILSQPERTFQAKGVFDGTLIKQQTEIRVKQEPYAPAMIPAGSASDTVSQVAAVKTPDAVLSSSKLLDPNSLNVKVMQ